MRQRSLSDAAEPTFYLPLAQAAWVDGIARSVRAPRFRALLLAVFGAAAVVVAVAGVYGVMAHSVNTRRREMAIRVALGATPDGLVGHVVRGGMLLTLAGVTIGVLGRWDGAGSCGRCCSACRRTIR